MQGSDCDFMAFSWCIVGPLRAVLTTMLTFVLMYDNYCNFAVTWRLDVGYRVSVASFGFEPQEVVREHLVAGDTIEYCRQIAALDLARHSLFESVVQTQKSIVD